MLHAIVLLPMVFGSFLRIFSWYVTTFLVRFCHIFRHLSHFALDESDLTLCVILGNRRSHKRCKILKILVYTFPLHAVSMELFYVSQCALTEMLYKLYIYGRCIRTGRRPMSSSLEILVVSILSGTHKSAAYLLNISDLHWC